eukprot:gnl/TRDRNA2_/TRDRNA2_178869_c0_seq1.p1 gnl/TRDRNA2_/TRDRNA2_178869_c0~~gnl/TRDRNA2_/TRDRNA2_178869_c0_seq1.p1  ORF type:complete len:363 (+),score=95.94 gnl/TRDRNA2_/TRDRNA2_178869_c0_seq1:73-1161(+)
MTASTESLGTALRKVTKETDLVQKEASEAEAAELTVSTLVVKKASAALKLAEERYLKMKTATVTMVKDPHFKTVTISAAGGTVTFGATGGAFGLCSGVVVGGAAGVLPALFTFGLSIPIGATIGGGTGVCVGTLVGAGSGAVAGGAAGHGVYKYRVEIHDGYVVVKTKAMDSVARAKKTVLDTIELTQVKIQSTHASLKAKASAHYTSTKEKASCAIMKVKTKSGKLYSEAREFSKTKHFKVTAASASGGAVVGGTAGGAGGMMTGGALGAAAGVPLALFTFGFSIPVGAMIGGTVGLCTGTVAGGSAGGVVGGTVGYKSYEHRKEIGDATSGAWTKVRAGATTAKTRVTDLLPAGWTGGSD